MTEAQEFLPAIRRLHQRIRDRVWQATASRGVDELAAIVEDDIAHAGDLVFAIDRVSEEELVRFVSEEIAQQQPLILIAEGLPGGERTLPDSASPEDCRWRMIVDPIDGTRPLMYQKRPGWILTGLAPNRGPDTRLSDIQLAVQTEIPLLKQYLCDQLWAVRGQGVDAERFNLLTGESEPLQLRPSGAKSIRYGYAAVSRFFSGMRDVLAEIEDELVTRTLGPRQQGETLTFEDQYASTAGQLYGLMSGSDRFLADLRPLMKPIAEQRGEQMGHCCHPYDICTLLIAEQLGVTITDPTGQPLDMPLDTKTDVAWLGYANQALRHEVEPTILEILRERTLIG